MDERKIYSMIGLAHKAGKVISGEDSVRNSIRKNTVKLVILSEDSSDNTKKRFINSAAYYNVPIVQWGIKEALGKCIGKSERSIVGITDDNFSKTIKELVGQTSNRRIAEKQKAGGELIE